LAKPERALARAVRAEAGAQVVEVVGQVRGRADQAHLEVAGEPAAAQAGVQHRRLEARIGSHQEEDVDVLQPGDPGIEQPGLPRAGAQGHAVLAAIGIGRAQGAEQVERRLQGLRVLQVAGDGANRSGLAEDRRVAARDRASAQVAGRSRPPRG
jgi:hypothetical protein